LQARYREKEEPLIPPLFVTMISAALFAHWQEELRVLAQAVVAIVLGGALGWERQLAGKYAGLRTHILVCLASMLFVRLGEMLIVDASEYSHPDQVRSDPAHLIAALATGISFIGAGTIFRDPSNEKARGLTTAASLLATAAIGVAVALDRYIIAVGIVLLCLFVLHTLRRLDARLEPHKNEKDFP
jgi:putative Mg2+ transporter-C (MgtC) family protein